MKFTAKFIFTFTMSLLVLLSSTGFAMQVHKCKSSGITQISINMPLSDGDDACGGCAKHQDRTNFSKSCCESHFSFSQHKAETFNSISEFSFLPKIFSVAQFYSSPVLKECNNFLGTFKLSQSIPILLSGRILLLIISILRI